MNTASQLLCEELVALSNWGIEDDNINKVWSSNGIGEWFVDFAPQAFKGQIPAYDLGYLIRKLPPKINTRFIDVEVVSYFLLEVLNTNKLAYCAGYITNDVEQEVNKIRGEDYIPENAMAKLCIELFKSGILKKEGL